MRRTIGTLTVLLGVTVSVLAADVDPKAIIAQVSETYGSLDSFHFELTITTEPLEGPETAEHYESPLVLAMGDEGKVRVEINDPTASLHAVFDGETTWLHVPQLSHFSRRSTDELAVGVGPTSIATDFGTQYKELV